MGVFVVWFGLGCGEGRKRGGRGREELVLDEGELER